MSKLILSKLNSLQQLKQKQVNWNMTWDQGVFLSNLVEIKKSRRILEIGTSNGFSTLWLAKNLNSNSTIDTIEVNEERFNLAKSNFNFCKLENINQLLGEAFKVLPNLKGIYDLVVVDAAQAFYKDLVQLFEKNNLIDNESILIFDNILTHEDMPHFIEFMKKRYLVEIIGIGGGFLFAKKQTNS